MNQAKNWKAGVLGVLALLAVAAAPVQGDTPPININTASATELTVISGIGPAKAKAIVDHREANGPFASVDDLRSVSGIGDKLLDQMRSQVTVGEPAAEQPKDKADKSE